MFHIQSIHLALIVALAVACTSTEPVDVTPHLNEEPVPLGFVVSDLTEQQNTQLMAMLATTIHHAAR